VALSLQILELLMMEAQLFAVVEQTQKEMDLE
jgi:hypothetical protein